MFLSYSAPAVSITLKIIESYDLDPYPLLKKLRINPNLLKTPMRASNMPK